MENEYCEFCGTLMEKSQDEAEPLLICRCPGCENIKYIRLNGYEG